ncbi:1-phosphofructokinase family hexose kinase [Microbacterium gorillae]|uniref:1-phosphofructokinase family hexose kinase n=1 Tax=Microbacterium gorillae TaxID=1231063 RepID=UPI000693E694|nr:1-phosphofructokinase family hexose kinase [Microbacterium gorillae]
MILTVTPNPALDLTWHVDALHPGSTHRVPTGVGRAGGKGLNVARVLHAAGVDTLALTTCGGATGEEFRSELETSGVPHRLVPVAADTRRSVAVVAADRGEATVLNEFGVAPSVHEATLLWDTAVAIGRTARAVAICGSLPSGMSGDALVGAVQALDHSGVPVLVDTSGPAMLAAAEARVTALKPNHEELRAATGLDDLRAGVRALHERGATLVLASLGEDGLLLAHRNGEAVRARFPEVVHGNATGAGDATVAAILVSLAEDPCLAEPGALEATARRAAAWGAAAVAMPLAGELDAALAARTADVIITPDTLDPTPRTEGAA